ncbi:MAG TPA: ABC transporter substrate-binding protein [Casimicrobiaceae bacterium]|nr:ABC transporter substrate-binding protein [Casimicrobiaceae bacterium]
MQRLRELGWMEGRTIAIEYRWAEGREERFPEIAAELVRLKVELIVTSGTPAVMASKKATSVIPIVFATAGDPVGSGLVASLARPGGNVTGISVQQDELAGKRVELLREIVPGLRRVAIIAYAGNPPSLVELEQAYAAARNFGLDAVKIEIRRMDEIASGLEPVTGNTEALYVVSHPLINANRIRISTLALGARMATICGFREYVEVGALMSYGPNLPALFRRAGEFVDKILRGTKAAELPVEQPTKWDLVFNLTTARALGLAIPESFLLRADELIE